MQYSLKIVSDALFHAYISVYIYGILKETGFTERYFCVYIYLTMFYVKSFIHISGVFEGDRRHEGSEIRLLGFSVCKCLRQLISVLLKREIWLNFNIYI